MAKIIEKIVVDTSQHDQKLKKAKAELRSYAASQQGMQNIMKGVTAAVGKFAAGLGIAMTATDSFKKILNASETTADEYGRVIQSVTTATDNFFYALNTGNLNNFFSNLNRSIQAARDLYDALDDVGSIKMNNRAAIAIQERALQELRVRKQEGQNVDAEMESVEERIKYLKNQEVNAQRKAAVKSVAATLSDVVDEDLAKKISAQLFVKGQDYFRQMSKEYERLRQKGTGTVVIGQGSSIGGAYSSNVAQAFSRDNLDAADRRLYDVVEAIVKKEAKLSEAIGMWADAENLAGAISQQEFRVNRWSGAGSGSAGRGSSGRNETESLVEGSLAWYQDKLSKANKDLQNAATDEARYAASKVVEEIQAQITRMKQTITMTDISKDFGKGELPKLGTDTAAMTQVGDLKKIEIAYESLEATATEKMDAVGYAMERMGHAVGGNAGEWLAWAGNLASAISTALPQIAALTAAKKAQASAEGHEAAIGAASAVANIPVVGPAMAVAAVASIIAALMSIPKFAKGGLAYGPTLGLFGEYSGAANNPEVVAPLDRLRTLMGEPGAAVGQVEFHIQGKELYGILNKQERTNTRNR